MRRVYVVCAAMILMLAFGVMSDAQQPPPDSQMHPPYPKSGQIYGDRRSFVGQLSVELVRQAEYLAYSSYDYFMGWKGMISESEQAILFKSEEFAAACRLFSKLVQDQTNYFIRESMRTNLHSAYLYVLASFHQLENIMRQGGMTDGFRPMRRDGRRFEPRTYRGPMGGAFGLAECRRILTRMESEFSYWR